MEIRSIKDLKNLWPLSVQGPTPCILNLAASNIGLGAYYDLETNSLQGALKGNLEDTPLTQSPNQSPSPLSDTTMRFYASSGPTLLLLFFVFCNRYLKEFFLKNAEKQVGTRWVQSL